MTMAFGVWSEREKGQRLEWQSDFPLPTAWRQASPFTSAPQRRNGSQSFHEWVPVHYSNTFPHLILPILVVLCCAHFHPLFCHFLDIWSQQQRQLLMFTSLCSVLLGLPIVCIPTVLLPSVFSAVRFLSLFVPSGGQHPKWQGFYIIRKMYSYLFLIYTLTTEDLESGKADSLQRVRKMTEK